jgi:hypothetical protein
MYKDGKFLDVDEFMDKCDRYDIPRVPVLYRGPFDMVKMEELAEGNSVLAEKNGEIHVREGCVIRPILERQDLTIGRVTLKLVGNGYYLSNK